MSRSRPADAGAFGLQVPAPRLPRSLWLAAGLFALASILGWLALLSVVQYEREETESAGRRAAESQAKLAATEVSQVLAGIENLILTVAAIRRHVPEQPVDTLGTGGVLLRTLAPTFWLVDAAGRVTTSTEPVVPSGTSLLDDEVFKRLSWRGRSTLTVDRAPFAGPDGEPMLRISRRLLDEDGSFDGVGMVAIRGQGLLQRIEPARLAGAVTTISSADATVLTASERSDGRGSGDRGYHATTDLDDLPLRVAVNLPEGEAIAKFESWRAALVGIAAIANMVLATGFFMALRGYHAQRAARQHAESANSMLEQVLDSFPHGVQIKDAELRYRWANKVHGDRTGIAFDRLRGKRPDETGMNPALALEVLEHDRLVLRTGRSQGPLEQAMPLPDGSSAYSFVTKIPILAGGKVSHIITVGTDVTELRLAQRRAEEAHRLLDAILQSAPAMVHVKDRDLVYRWVNADFARQMGAEPQAIIGRRASDFSAPSSSVQSSETNDRTVLETGETLRRFVEFRPPGQNGALRHYLVTKAPVLDDRGLPSHVVSFSIDVTDLRRAEAEAASTRRLVDEVIRHAPITINVKDRDLRYRWVNPAFCQMMGSEPDALIGHRAEEFAVHTEHAERVRARDLEVIESGTAQNIESAFFPPSRPDTPLHFLGTKAPITDDSGAVTHLVTYGVDVTELKRAQQAAAAAKDLLDAVVRNLPLAVHVRDAARRYHLANPAYAMALGFSAEEAQGLDLLDKLGDRTGLPDANEQDDMVFATGATVGPYERSFTGPAGKAFDTIVSKIPLRDADGKVDRVLSVGIDITARRRAERALGELNRELERRVVERTADLARSNELVAKVVSGAPIPIVTYGTDGCVTSWNAAAERITGFASAEVIGRLPPTQDKRGQAQFAEMARRIARGESYAGIEVRRHRKDGAPIDLMISGAPLIDADGAISGAIGIWMDVTEQRAAEREMAQRTAELARSNDLVAKMIASAPIPIVTYDLEGRLTSWNAAAERVTGYTADEVMGRLPPTQDDDGRAQFLGMLQRVAKGESYTGTEGKRRRKDGRTIDLLFSGAPLTDADGSISGSVAVWMDVTEQRAVERQLHQAQKMEIVGQLSGGIAHDFNNLLSVVIGNLEMAQEATDRDMAEALQREALAAALRSSDLTRRLLAFSRPQALAARSVDPAAAVRGMHSMLASALGARVTLSIEADAATWPVTVDQPQLESAVLNLCVNARDAMPDGGTLTIRIGNEPGAGSGPDRVRLDVIDTGLGMPPAVAARAFEPFFTTKQTGKGTGLGLSMVYAFARQSGGEATLDSMPGQGTTVSIRLPRAIPAEREAIEAQAENLPAGRGQTVLLVEDNTALATVTTQQLQQLGYRVLCAASAEEALPILHGDGQIDLLFSDVVVPGAMDGRDLALAAARLRPRLPCLLTTGYEMQAVSERPETAALPVLSKPYRRGDLARAVRAAIDAGVARAG